MRLTAQPRSASKYRNHLFPDILRASNVEYNFKFALNHAISKAQEISRSGTLHSCHCWNLASDLRFLQPYGTHSTTFAQLVSLIVEVHKSIAVVDREREQT